MPVQARSSAGPAWGVAPAVAVTVVFFVVPLIVFAIYSFLTSGLYRVSAPLTLDSYSEAVSSELNRTLAKNSVVIGGATAATCVALGLPIAFWLRHGAGRWRVPVLFLITASMFASYLVRIFAWRSILGANGLVNSALEALGLVDEPVGFLLFTRGSVTVALVHIFLPYVVLVLYAGMGPLGDGLLEAARDLGAGPLGIWRRLILPVMAAPSVTSFLFVFILSASDYVTPQLLGGTGGATLGAQIQTNFIGVGNWPLAAATSFLMLLAFITCYGLAAAILRVLRLHDLRFSS